MKESPKHPASMRHGARQQQEQALGSPVNALLSSPLDTAEVRDVADGPPPPPHQKHP